MYFAGQYGSAVASYFVFLKMLFFMNLYICMLTTSFITVPQIVFDAQVRTSHGKMEINI